MKPSSLLESLIKQYFKDCHKEDSESYRIVLSCDEYKIMIDKSNLGFTSYILDKDNNQRYRSSLNEITAYSMSKKFGLEIVYENEFKSIKEHLENIKYEDKIKDMFENEKINELNDELNNQNLIDYQTYLIKKYARKFGYIFDNNIKKLVKGF